MTEENGKYNGYTKYETWLVSLWFDNTPGDYADVMETLKRVRAENPADKVRGELADAIEEYLTEIIADDQDKVSGISSDYLGRLVSGCDYFELADNLIRDYPEDKAGDE